MIVPRTLCSPHGKEEHSQASSLGCSRYQVLRVLLYLLIYQQAQESCPRSTPYTYSTVSLDSVTAVRISMGA